MATPNELTGMRRAIAISAQGLGTTSPNPPVGCVILDRDGVPVGEGYHLRKGRPPRRGERAHRSGERAEGGTAVVTLEPCNHHGRTPPCRQALIDAKVSRVLMAVMDPTHAERVVRWCWNRLASRWSVASWSRKRCLSSVRGCTRCVPEGRT